MFYFLKKPIKDSGFNHWGCPSNFHSIWINRIEQMAKHLDPEEKVLDFGCGMMWLEKFLKKGNSYIPIDFVKRDARTIICDFNSGEFPNIFDGIAFLSGILEYIQNLETFVEKLKSHRYKKIILSYCTVEMVKSNKKRKKLNWVNHESIFTLIAWFFPEYSLIDLDNNIPNNTILVFQSNS